jgi:hypothetical protein
VIADVGLQRTEGFLQNRQRHQGDETVGGESHMYSGKPRFVACVHATLARTTSGVVQILQSETLKVSNSRSPEVLDRDG